MKNQYIKIGIKGMSASWIFMAIVWAIAEAIGYFRKKSFKIRVKSGARWAVAISTLSLAGSLPLADQQITLVFLISFFMVLAVAIPIYFLRLKAFSFILNRFQEEKSNDEDKGKNKTFYFHSCNLALQSTAIAAGFLLGLIAISLSTILIFLL